MILHNSPTYRLEVELHPCHPDGAQALTFYSTVKPPFAKTEDRRQQFRVMLDDDRREAFGRMLATKPRSGQCLP